MSRARANWRRVALMRNKMHRGVEAFHYVQSWHSPTTSLICMLSLIMLSFRPHIIISLILLFLTFHAWSNHDPNAGKPMHMESDPEAEEDNEEVCPGTSWP